MYIYICTVIQLTGPWKNPNTLHTPCTLSSLVVWSHIPTEHTLNNGRCTSWNFSKTWAKPLNPQALENNIIYIASIINIVIWEKFIEIKMTWTVYHFAEDDTGCCRGCERVDGNWFKIFFYPQHLLHNSFSLSLSLLIFCMVKRNDVYIHQQNSTAKKSWCVHTQTKFHSKKAMMYTYTNKMPQQRSPDVYIHKQNATAKKPLNMNIIVANLTK